MNKRKFIIILIILILIFLLLSYNVSRAYFNKINFEKEVLEIAEKNSESIFIINNITFFSSANSKYEIKSNSSLTLNNLFQYTDIAIFINPVNKELSYKNTYKDVFINNINFINTPSLGIPNLYYKNINEFTTPNFKEENKIENDLSFSISSESSTDLSTPILYNNCANPISLCYVNNNIKTDYTLPDAFSQITYDGSLLKKCGVTLSTIACSLSFDIHIINNLDEEYVCPIYIEIPLESSTENIYNGKILEKNNINNTFYRIK